MFFPAFKGQQVSVARSDNELARMSYTLAAAEREMTVQDLLRRTAGLAYGEITVNTPVRDAYAKAGLYLAGVAAWGFCQSCRRVGCTGSAAVRRGFR